MAPLLALVVLGRRLEASLSVPAVPAPDRVTLEGASHGELVELAVVLVEANAALAASVGVLSGRVEVLEAQLAAARSTSRTSSKPPSLDGYAKPAPTSRRTRSGRKPGGQRGAPGSTLRQVAEPDVVVEHRPSACRGCGCSLAGRAPASWAARQVADLPAVKLVWTEHRLATVACGCGRRTSASALDGVPAWAVGPAQYGPGVRAAASYLHAAHYLPDARCAMVLADLLGAPVSPGTIVAWQQGGEQVLAGEGGFLDQVREQLRGADVLHADETGLRTAGALAWVRVAASEHSALLSVHAGHGRRGRAAIAAAGVVEHLRPDAVLVSDAWAPYLTYGCLHALCGAHVVRELRAVFEAAPTSVHQDGAQTWAHKMLRLLERVNTEARTARAGGRQHLDPDLLAAAVAGFEAILALAHAQNPAPPGGWPGAKRRPKAVNLLLRIETHREDYLRYASDLAVPFTNNLAERDLRGIRLHEKTSGCLRTLAGAKAMVAMRSYLLTTARHGLSALAVLRDLHTGHPWTPALTTG